MLGETIDLLEEIAHDTDDAGDPPLLAAIADGTFGLMKRPADARPRPRRRGPQGAGYYNPATEILEE